MPVLIPSGRPTLQLYSPGVRFQKTCARKVGDVTVIDDLSAATEIRILFQAPSTAAKVRLAALLTDGTDGVAYYDTTAADLDEAGTWKWQLVADMPEGPVHYPIDLFDVRHNVTP